MTVILSPFKTQYEIRLCLLCDMRSLPLFDAARLSATATSTAGKQHHQ